MANYETLKAAIQQVVKTNGNNEITGALLQQSLLAMINSLGSGYQFVDVATSATKPGTPDQKVFYIANGKGTYPNFGGISITEDEVVILYYDTDWHKLLTGIASNEKLSELGQEVDGVNESITPTWTQSKRIVESGNIVSSSTSFYVSDFIGVESDVTLTVQGIHSYVGTQMPGIHFYDANQKHIGYLYGDGNIDITGKIAELDARYIRLSHYDDGTYLVGDVRVTKFSEAKFASAAELKTATNYITPASVASLATEFSLIGTNDGIIYPSKQDYIATEAYPCGIGKTFRMENVAGVALSWYRIYYYLGDTYVGYKQIGTTVQDYTTIAASGAYDNVRFCFAISSGTFASTDDISVETDVPETVVPVKQVVSELDERVTKIENGTSYQSEIDDINNGYRVPTDADFTQSIDGHFKIENGSLYGKRGSSDPAVMMVFNEGIKAIEFEFASLWDSNLISLVFGLGVDTGNNKPCFAQGYLNTSARPNDAGSVINKDYDGNASAGQATSIWGQGHGSGDYRNPQAKPYAVAVGDKCRIELIDGHYFKASVYNASSGCWDFWWCLDTDGTWNNPKMGWTTRRAIGFEISFGTISTWKELIKNIRIVSEGSKTSGIYSELYNDFPERKQWVAIGDSITEIDKNNGLSYVGYAQRKLGFKVDNQGKGGWTIYKLWRDRATAGWENAVSAINDGDLVTILAGTNDFDTASFATPSSDEAMDAAGNPHPRFGTTDPTSEDAKDPHTTLGCLRLMIERILTLKPGARLSVFSPFYREKGAPIGQTSWSKLYINSDGKTIYDYADAIYSVAREYNLPAYNTCRDCGINALTLTTYTYDDLHIGQLGGELIGDYVAKRIS